MLLTFNLVLDLLLALFWIWIIRKRRAHEGEERLLREQERFLEELAGQYAKRGDMLEALEESMQVCTSRAQRELMGLLDALKTDGGPEDGIYSGNSAKNPCFFRAVFSIRGSPERGCLRPPPAPAGAGRDRSRSVPGR